MDFDQRVISTRYTLLSVDTSQTQVYFGQVGVDANLDGSEMTWTSLKLEGQLDNIFYATSLVIWTQTATCLGLVELAELLHVLEADEEQEEAQEEGMFETIKASVIFGELCLIR